MNTDVSSKGDWVGRGLKGRRRQGLRNKPTRGKAGFTHAVRADLSHDISGKKTATLQS